MALVFPPTKLDLDSAADRARLFAENADDASAIDFLTEQLTHYRRFFPAPEWGVVYSGGHVTAPGTTQGFGLEHLLTITNELRVLEQLPGGTGLVASLRNPTQVRATIFEIESATWCTTRLAHRGLEFGVPVVRNGKLKRPEFRWSTELGTLWCECKEASRFSSKATALVNRLATAADAAYEAAGPWPADSRVDVFVTGVRNGIEKVIERTVREMHRSAPDGGEEPAVSAGEVRVTHRLRSSPRPLPRDCLSTFRVTVGTTPTKLDPSNAHISVTLDVSRHIQRVTARLIREARAQLPTDEPNAVFLSDVGIGSAIDAVTNQIESGGSLVFAGLWNGGTLQQVWRNEQPFDDQLLVEAPPVPEVPVDDTRSAH